MSGEQVNVFLSFGHPSFQSGKSAVVVVERLSEGAWLQEYRDLAKKKLCEKLDLSEHDVIVFDYKVLGELLFIE